MQHLNSFLFACPVALLFLGHPVAAQTEIVTEIPRPANTQDEWGRCLSPLADLDGDGIGELAVGRAVNSGEWVATVHSGVDGTLLFSLIEPFQEMVLGRKVLDVADVNGDGIRDLAHVSGNILGVAGSLDGLISLHSGMDGTLLSQVGVPPGLRIQSFSSDSVVRIDDLDGDGIEDLRLRTFDLARNQYGWAAISTLTGQVILPTAWAIQFGSAIPLDDHDGDGLEDYGYLQVHDGELALGIYSTASSDLIDLHALPSVPLGWEIGEPTRAVPDMDGDGLRDVAIGSLTGSWLSVHSSATGLDLATWDCDQIQPDCLGERVQGIQDLNFDGKPDLLVAGNMGFVNEPGRLYGLDVQTGNTIFEQTIDGLQNSIWTEDGMVVMQTPGASGFPLFAVANPILGELTIRRFAPTVGETVCVGESPAGESAPTLQVVGSGELAHDRVVVEIADVSPSQAVALFAGVGRTPGPFSSAGSCLIGSRALLNVGVSDSRGHLHFVIDTTAWVQSIGTNWTLQASTRSQTGSQVVNSNAVGVELF